MVWVVFATGSGSISSNVSCIRIQQNYTDPKTWFKFTLSTIGMSWLHISMRFCATTARRSLLWNNFPSKKSHGQHMRKGTGAPHASLARRAMSTPCIKRVASWTPLGVTRSSFIRAMFSESISSGDHAVTRKASNSRRKTHFEIMDINYN